MYKIYATLLKTSGEEIVQRSWSKKNYKTKLIIARLLLYFYENNFVRG